MQEIVNQIENRNFNILSFGIIATAATTVLNIYTDNTNVYCNIVIPIITLIAVYYAAFNNKVSAYIRGYLAGLEESINYELKEEIFLWNKGYSEFFHGKYFPTNSYISVLCLIVILGLSVFSFYNMFVLIKNLFWLICWVLYVIFFLAFLFVFTYDLLTNSQSNQYTRLYFHLLNKRCDIKKLKNIKNTHLDRIKTILNIKKQ